MLEPRECSLARQLTAEGRILDALADGAALVGMATEVAARFDLGVQDFDACLSSLKDAHWVRIELGASNHLVIHLES